MRDAPEPGGTPSDATLIEGHGLSVDASWGHIYGPVDLRVRTGGVTVLAGPEGRGRTALLLTLAGRMKPTKGELVVLPRDVGQAAEGNVPADGGVLPVVI
ncbi:ATP-binding cassette domain-containing protein, partial [Gordonia alkanivorans]|uniref:ATP-binding cassette domain-containing protein n=2 Tax=Gordonia alkanivorans TaxID=84096 RepID=UPI00301497D7